MSDVTLSEIDRLRAAADAADAVFEMDEAAFRALYDRTARALWAYLARITGSADLADDLLQETYYRFLRSRSSYESDAHRRHSLFRIATNLAHDCRRRGVRAHLVPLSEDDVMVATDVAAETERRADLARAMSHLRPRERAMLWLAYAHGSPHRDIASMVGVKAESVRLLLFRARHKLAALLRNGGAKKDATRLRTVRSTVLRRGRAASEASHAPAYAKASARSRRSLAEAETEASRRSGSRESV